MNDNTPLDPTGATHPAIIEEIQGEFQAEDLSDKALEAFLKNSGIEALSAKIQELEKATQDIEAKTLKQQAQRELESLQTRLPHFDPATIAKVWQDLAEEDLPLARALDNPTGWELLYYVHMAKQAERDKTHKPDVILGGSGAVSQGGQGDALLERIRNGQGSFADFGRIFG